MKELLTGKNKENFKAWHFSYLVEKYERHDYCAIQLAKFDRADFLEQIGVLLAYYDYYAIIITLYENDGGGHWGIYMTDKQNGLSTSLGYKHKSRNEAYQEAFKKANELINNK